MKSLIVIACLLCAATAAPAPEPATDIDLVTVPLKDNKELDIITLAGDDGLINERNKRTIGILRQMFPTLSQVNLNDEESVAAASEQLMEQIRVARQTNEINALAIDDKPSDQEAHESQNGVQSNQNEGALDELTLDGADDDENRNKRFLSFGGGAAAGGGAAGGGSGNFLFDIIRSTADRAARAAGTVYRVVAGTESLDAHLLTPTSTGSRKSVSTKAPPIDTGGRSKGGGGDVGGGDIQASSSNYYTTNNNNNNDAGGGGQLSLLVSGGSGSQQTDEQANAATDDGAKAGGDGYTEGIPGPVTRLFVLANRGISNLVQDLILRLAQTSERVVNFKARLITALI